MSDLPRPLLAAIVLTKDEEKHIARCLDSLKGICDEVLVLDSGSSDYTADIARAQGARVEVADWINYGVQMNRAIRLLADRSRFLLRIDADEVLAANIEAIRPLLQSVEEGTDGILVKRRMHFMGRRLRFGGMDPIWQLRIWRNGRGRCEERWMDEHILVEGAVKRSSIIVEDINLNSLTWWTEKHNRYASREAADILAKRHGLKLDETLSWSRRRDQVSFKRRIKEKVFLRLPAGARALLFFFVRYILLFGFLDGRPGWYFHVLQGFWYRTLVDAKVVEIEERAHHCGWDIPAAVRSVTGIDISAASRRTQDPPAAVE